MAEDVSDLLARLQAADSTLVLVAFTLEGSDRTVTVAPPKADADAPSAEAAS